MFDKKVVGAVSLVAILMAAVTANAQFRSSGTGSGSTSSTGATLCVGDPAVNTPCIDTDDAEEYGEVLDLKTKADGGTLVASDITAEFDTTSVNTGSDDTITYLGIKLGAAISAGNENPSKKHSDLQTIVSGATDETVGRWVICQAAGGTNGYDGITNSELNTAFTNAGVSSTILTDVGVTINTLNSNISSSGLACTPTSTQIENWITTTAGFPSSVTYANVETAIDDNNWSTANYKAASAKGYTNSSADELLYDEALGSTYTASCTAEVASASACTDLTKTQFTSAKAGSALFAAKKVKATNGTLVRADLTELVLTTSTLGTPTSAQMDYLMAQLDKSASATKSDWQATINAYTTTNAALWLIGELAAGNETDTTLATQTLFNSAGASSTISSAVTNSQIASGIATSSLTSSSTTSALNTWLVSILGFSSDAIYTAWNNAGHTTSTFPVADYESCYSSTATGASACSITKSAWDNLSPLLVSDETTITNAQLGAYYGSRGITNSTFTTSTLSSFSTIEGNYVRDCIGDLSSITTSTLDTCVSTTNATDTSFARHQCSGVRSGRSGYADSLITLDLLDDLGVFANDSYARDLVNGNYCGSYSTSNKSCMDAVVARIKTSSDPCNANAQTRICGTLKSKIRDYVVSGRHFTKRYIVEACQRAVISNAFSSSNFPIVGMPNFDSSTGVYSLDGSPFKTNLHANHTPTSAYALGHTDTAAGLTKSGNDLIIEVSGNPDDGNANTLARRSRAYRIVGRFKGGNCVPANNYYGNPHSNSMTFKFTVSYLENATDSAANTMSFTETQTKPAYSCTACQASSGQPSWCTNPGNVAGYSDDRYKACPSHGGDSSYPEPNSENGHEWEPTSGTFGRTSDVWVLNSGTTQPSSVPALRTVSACGSNTPD